jgi:hypothetical protein
MAELPYPLAPSARFAYDFRRRRSPMKKLNLGLALAAGFVGGMLSHTLTAPAVQAESPAAAEVRARSFLLVNEKGQVVGKFSAESGGRPSIRLFDATGREIWSAEGPVMRGATGR